MLIRRLMAGLLLLGGTVGCGLNTKTASDGPAEEEPGASVTVRAELARRGTMSETVQGLGRCEALPDHIATLTPAVEGHVHELLVKQGDPVKKGQPIVELDEAVARADLAEKTATRDGLKASLAVLKSLPRREEQAPTELAVEQAKVAVERAQAVVEGPKSLRGDNLVSKQQIFDAEKALEQARIQQQTAEATLHVMMIGPRPEAVAEAEGKIKTADALVAFSKAHLDYHTIRAPIDGMLDSLTCHPGQTIAIGTPIGEVVDTRQVFASIWLPTRSASSVRVGQAARVRPGGCPRFGGRTPRPRRKTGWRARSRSWAGWPTRRPATCRSASWWTTPRGGSRSGESVRVSITVNERKDVLQVPAAAILDLGEGPVLNVVREGKTVVLHPEVGDTARRLGGGRGHRPEGGRAGDRRGRIQPARGDAGQTAGSQGRWRTRSRRPPMSLTLGAGNREPLELRPAAGSTSSPWPGRTSG